MLCYVEAGTIREKHEGVNLPTYQAAEKDGRAGLKQRDTCK